MNYIVAFSTSIILLRNDSPVLLINILKKIFVQNKKQSNEIMS